MEKNQCDGCNAGVPLDERGYHRMGQPGNYADYMVCQAGKYRPLNHEVKPYKKS